MVTPMRLGPADHGRRMTLEEFMNAEVEEGYRYELARGVVEASEVPDDPHGVIVWIILQLIARYAQEHPGVIHRAGGGSEFRLWLPAMISGRNPDVAVALSKTPKDRRGRRPPSLVFEVVSEGAEAHERDYQSKRAEHLAYGLREYWIVDPPGANRHGPGPRRRRLGRADLPRRSAGRQPGPARLHGPGCGPVGRG